MGWLADVTYAALADLYTAATVPQLPQVHATARLGKKRTPTFR